MKTIDDYLKKVTPTQKIELERVRNIIRKNIPDVEEAISYGMPTFKYKGEYVIYFAAYKNHMSLYGSMSSVEAKLGKFKISKKGTLQFTENNPVPESIIKEIIRQRLKKLS